MKEIIEEINYEANNIEEICCGIRLKWQDYKDDEKRIELINQLDHELIKLNESLDKLRKI